jgi:hypothetical protein
MKKDIDAQCADGAQFHVFTASKKACSESPHR